MHTGFTRAFVSIVGAGHDPAAPTFFAEERSMKRLIALMLLAMFSMGSLTACNTMAGVGRDVEKVGDKIEDKAEDCNDGKC